jgi:hypothetical protein
VVVGSSPTGGSALHITPALGHVPRRTGLLQIRRNYRWLRGRTIEKDTKTHQLGRTAALDAETVDVLAAPPPALRGTLCDYAAWVGEAEQMELAESDSHNV